MSYKNVAISNHAVQRFRQRFRLHYHKSIFEENRERYMIKTLFDKSSSSDFALKMCSGKYNAACIKHGSPVHFYDYNNLIRFCCVERDGVLLIATLKNIRNL